MSVAATRRHSTSAPTGFFVPLVVLSAILGRLGSAITGTASSGLFPILGVAALLGADYGVPLAAVMFVAETSGRLTWTPFSLSVQVASLCRSRMSRQVVATSAGVR